VASERGEIRLDEALLPSVERAVRELGGAIEETGWVVVGSQEITSAVVRLPGGELELHLETYDGLRLRGPRALLDEVRAALARVVSGAE
jgi:hypothetical protein